MTPERKLLGDLFHLLRRMEACPAHDVPVSQTGVKRHRHPDPSRVGPAPPEPEKRCTASELEAREPEKRCTASELEAREREYERLMGKIKNLLENAPS